MAKRKRYPKLPNGFGSIKKLSGKNRLNPYGVYPPTTEWTDEGIPVATKALCYVDDWYKGFAVLTWYNQGEYFPGKEKELSGLSGTSLQSKMMDVLQKYTQTQREVADQKTFEDVFQEYYLQKFGAEYGHTGKKKSIEYSMIAAYKHCADLHDKGFRALTTADLQRVIDGCELKHSSIELIATLLHQMYKYADANDLCDKDYSKHIVINKEDDDEHGVPFTPADLDKLWQNKDDHTVELLLIMCYSGFRISEYKKMAVNLKDGYLQGGMKTKAGKDRIVPIHSGIRELVAKRMKRDKALLLGSTGKFRTDMYAALERIGIEKHTPHDCRHTFNVLCDKYEVSERDKKLMLGHAFQDVTNKVYGHRSVEDLRKEIEKIKIHINE